MTDKKFTAAEAAQLVLEALKVKAKGALEKAQKGRAVKKQVAPAGIDPAKQARSDYITPPQPATSDASKMTFPKLDTPWTGRYPKGDARNDMGQKSGEDNDTYVNRTFGAGTAERGRKFFDAGMDQDIKAMQNPPKAPAAPKASASAPKTPTAPKPPTSTKPEPLDWSEEKPEGTASEDGSESTESSSSEFSKAESLAFAAAKKFHLGDESGAAELIGLCKSEASSESAAVEMLADAFEAFEKAQSVQFAPLSEGWQDIASGKPLDGKFDGVVPGAVKSKPSNPDRQKVQVKGEAKLTTVDKDKPIKKEEPLSGGLSEGSAASDYDPEQLAAGTKVEMEHTDDEKAAQKIAMDHLTEDPDYYKKLKTMEAEKCEGSCSKRMAKGTWEEMNPDPKAAATEAGYQRDVKAAGLKVTPYENRPTHVPVSPVAQAHEQEGVKDAQDWHARARKDFGAWTDEGIKDMQAQGAAGRARMASPAAPKAPAAAAPAAPKAPTAPKPPKSTGPEPLDWSEKNPEETASGEASASKEEVSEPLAKRPSHEWNWQEPEAGLDVEGLDREHTGYAHATDEGGYHVARVNPVKGGFNFTHSHTAPGGEEKVVHASSSFKTPHEAHAHLREYTGAK